MKAFINIFQSCAHHWMTIQKVTIRINKSPINNTIFQKLTKEYIHGCSSYFTNKSSIIWHSNQINKAEPTTPFHINYIAKFDAKISVLFRWFIYPGWILWFYVYVRIIIQVLERYFRINASIIWYFVHLYKQNQFVSIFQYRKFHRHLKC